jgi:hypothetical protein
MDQLRTITNTINTFVHFFQSINCLFWQVRWLEENVMRSSGSRIMLIGGIILFCAYISFVSNDSNPLNGVGVIIIIFGIVGVILWKRFWTQETRAYEALPIQEGVVIGELESGVIPQHCKRPSAPHSGVRLGSAVVM